MLMYKLYQLDEGPLGWWYSQKSIGSVAGVCNT